MHGTTNTIATFGPFIWLGLFLVVAWVINKLARKPIANGALTFIWVVLALLVWSAIMLFRPNNSVQIAGGPYYAFGEMVADYLIPFLLALYLSRRFRRRSSSSPPVAEFNNF